MVLVASLWLAGFLALNSDTIRAQANSEDSIRQRVNAGTVTLITGGVDGVSNTYQQLASDLAGVLDVKSELRVLPVIGYGSMQNIEDLLYLKGIDVGMVHSDVLRHTEQQRKLLGAKRRLRYITKLYDEQLHVLASTKFTSVKQLNGQTVIVGRPGSGNEMSALTLIGDLGLKVNLTHVEFKEGVQHLRTGRAAAMIVVTRKPSSKLRKIKANSGLHFLPVPMTKTILRTYDPDPLTAEDYPNLVPPSKPIETARMAAVLAVYNWKSDSSRSANVLKFISTFTSKLEKLKQASRKDVWQKLDLGGKVKGWKRFRPAEPIIQKAIAARPVASASDQPANESLEFSKFAEFVNKTTGKTHSADELLKLYLEYKDWFARPKAQTQ
ncbi:MAG: TAXI family TRAP transporter solute-binding subunit [Aestuariivirgaceae bacterium]